jgi:hypothetical protein
MGRPSQRALSDGDSNGLAYQHLKKPRHPAIDLMGTMHESFLKHESESPNEMDRIIEGAKGIDRRRFENIYDREFFHPGESAR